MIPPLPVLFVKSGADFLRTAAGISLIACEGVSPLHPDGIPKPSGGFEAHTIRILNSGDPLPPPENFTLVFLLGDPAHAKPEGRADVELLPEPVTFEAVLMALWRRWPAVAMALSSSKMKEEFDAQSLVLDQLTEVSIALSAERNYQKLLDLILSRALLLSGCDAGSLYLKVVDDDDDKRPPRLRFTTALNNSVSMVETVRDIEMPIATSFLAGYVALTGKPITIDDVYAIPEDAPYKFNPAFDLAAGYRTKSQLVIPMTNHKGEITGVMQLINKKRDPTAILNSKEIVESQVIPFDAHTTKLMNAVGSMAAVAIDNNRLYANIERLFEGFVKASVTAIEQRDPTTSGHSLRVCILTVDLAEKVGNLTTGPLAPYSFTQEQYKELRYASLLHDFGKVGVREQVLVKAKKLYPFELERILTRLELARLYRELELMAQKHGEHLCDHISPREVRPYPDLQDLDRFKEVILRANEPTVLPEGDFSTLQEIARFAFEDREGNWRPILEPEEISVLSIRKGSLNDQERIEIESHVTHTYHFLKRIPWTREFKAIPDIAYGHHEKLNGKGYPRHIPGDDIPIQSKMMTVADIFDALSASDRPYKRAVPVEKALDILKLEVKDGLLDPHLVDLFIEAKIYEKTLDLRTGARLE